ncbi:MAG: cysteine hydrolase [Deltaproteobacteria bacterium]|nr:cysteine hydrolase [Deltaproteobacteria bacterium]
MPEKLVLERRKTAVLVVDMQNAFIDPKGSLARMGVPVARNSAPIPHISRLLEAARAAGVRVVHLQFVLRGDLGDLGALGKRFPPLRELKHCAEGSWDAAFYAGMEPKPGDYVIQKNRFSGFHGTPLDATLRCVGVDTVIVTGVATNVCVECTVRDAFMRDYRVVVPRETTSAYSEEMEAASMGAFGFMFATVAGVDEVMAALA